MESTRVPETLAGLVVPIDNLKPYPANPRHGDVGAICESLRVHGQYRPIVVRRETNEILAGNHTWLAARELGWSEIAVTWVSCSDEQAARIVIVDNRSNDLAGTDDALLADLLESLPDLAGTGFDERAFETLLDSLAEPEPTVMGDVDDVPEPPPPITVPGDLWQLGPHRLLCGDARDPADVARLLDGARIDLAFTSPPYAEQRDYDETSGFKPIPPDGYVEWFAPVAENVATHLVDAGSWFVNIKPSVTDDGLDTLLYVHDLVAAHVREWGWHFATEFCWERSGVPKNVVRRFKNGFEPVYQFTRSDWKRKMRPDAVRHPSDNVPMSLGPGSGNTAWDVRQGKGGVIGSDRRPKERPHGGRGGMAGHSRMEDAMGTTWQPGEAIGDGLAYPTNRIPAMAHTHTALGHSAAFPVGLPEFFTNAFTDEGDNVFDPFMGSGSTLIAAHKTNRVGYGMEISPAYADIVCRRYETVTGDVPIHVETGTAHTFTEAA